LLKRVTVMEGYESYSRSAVKMCGLILQKGGEIKIWKVTFNDRLTEDVKTLKILKKKSSYQRFSFVVNTSWYKYARKG